MAEAIYFRGNIVDVLNNNGDVVPEDRNDFDRLHDLDIPPQHLGARAIDEVYPNTRGKKPGPRPDGLAVEPDFCGDCLRSVGPWGCAHIRPRRPKRSRAKKKSSR